MWVAVKTAHLSSPIITPVIRLPLSLHWKSSPSGYSFGFCPVNSGGCSLDLSYQHMWRLYMPWNFIEMNMMWWHGWLFMCLFLRRHASLFFTDSQVWPHPFSQETVNSRFEPYQQNCIQNISLWRTLHYSLRLGDCKNCIWMVFHWWFILPWPLVVCALSE